MKLFSTIALAAALVAVPVHTSRAAQSTDADAHWVGAWGWVASPPQPGPAPTRVAPQPPPLGVPPPAPPAPAPAAPRPPLLENPGGLPVDFAPGVLANVTLRQIVRVSASGSRVRLRLSNESSGDVQVIGDVHLALAGPDGAIVAGSDRAVTFDGQARVAIPAGAPVLSDPIALDVRALDRLAVSVFVPGQAAVRGARTLWTYVPSAPGDLTGATSLPGAHLRRAPVYATLVEVDAPHTSAVVTLGDSITEGDGSTGNAFHAWPDRLADRLAARPGPDRWSVVNAGISGNRVLRYGSGPDALARFDRDVLSVPGVRVIVLLEGINDIGRGFAPTGDREPVTAVALEAAYRQIIERAHAHGIRVLGATLTPYKGAFYASDSGEAAREATNAWIKTSGAFDGVIDFAAVVADPNDPLSFAPAFNDRDHLHPNDAGYKAMADAIDLRLITGR
ncbi:MAG TPA: SGNH/GDSL hydrolase family protein [Vicinamibacterales bacterium]|jgi:lysophospholipase L1-like esterase|nr:SGNH/GDSL hydrolase family protein [Vicinamibacterales bacterium]